MTTADDVRLFAYRQGPGKRRLGEQGLVDDDAVTTSLLPPPGARAATGRPLPAGTYDLLAAARYPGRCAAVGDPADRLGHLLLAAFGLQRREPANLYNDHRVVPSGRARFPVHAFVAQAGRLRYLDLYRHALVDTTVPVPGGDPPAVVLAARYTDLPGPYGRLRSAVTEVELGVYLRSLAVAADLLRVPARLLLDRDATDAVAATGPGVWSPPLVVRLDGLTDVPAGSTGLASPGGGAGHGDRDGLLTPAAGSLAELVAVAAHRRGLPAEPPEPVHGLPKAPPSAPVSWAEVFWRRSAGRVPKGVFGFALTPAEVAEAALRGMLDWLAVEPPDEWLRRVGARVRITVALQRVGGRATGAYRLESGEPVPHRLDEHLLRRLQPGFGRPPSADTDAGLRHASMVWVFSTDIGALLDELGPAAWSLLQLWCGWATHGLCLAAAAHGLVARPARSFDEHHLQPLAGLHRKDVPVFMTVCGVSRFTEPMLDLRS